MKNTDTIDYTHPELNKKVEAVSGYYIFEKEDCLSYNKRDVLYFTGHAHVDSCCGVGGTIFSYVAGFVIKLKYKSSKQGKRRRFFSPRTSLLRLPRYAKQ